MQIGKNVSPCAFVPNACLRVVTWAGLKKKTYGDLDSAQDKTTAIRYYFR
jgi:hypothetical protein